MTPASCGFCARPLRPGDTFAPDHPGTVRHHGRGLCTTCYNHARDAGTLPPRLTRAASDVVEDVEWITAHITRLPIAADRLGMRPKSLERALYRAGRNDLVRKLKDGR